MINQVPLYDILGLPGPPSSKNWSSTCAYAIAIRDRLKLNQRKCAYCGLPFSQEEGNHIDHIAPKEKHKEFAFTPFNLVLACPTCNGPSFKHDKETINVKNTDYNLCCFLIVHPYFDDPDTHYDWNGEGRILSVIIGKSQKGKNSIEMFGLNTEAMHAARSRYLKAEEYDRGTQSNKLLNSLFNRIRKRFP